MDDFENFDHNLSAEKLTNKSLMKLKRKQSQFLREQSTLLPAYKPPTLQLDDLISKKPKTAPKIDRTKIKKLLFEAGIDLSKTVTIGKQTYDNVFNNDPVPIEKLKQHTLHDQQNFDDKIDRREFQKKTLTSIQNSKRCIKAPQNRNPSRLSDLERDIWNNEQKQIEMLKCKQNIQKLYDDRSSLDLKPIHTMSLDLFDAENDSISDEDDDVEKLSDNSNTTVKIIKNPIVSSIDFTQDMANLCSGNFESQFQPQINLSNPEDSILADGEEGDIEPIEVEPIEVDRSKPTKPIEIVKANKKLKIADFIEIEAEQSGSDVSLGTDGSDSEEGSLHEFILHNEASNSQNNEIKRAHVHEMFYEDELQLEAIKNLHFPDTNRKISLGIEKEDDSDSTIDFDITSQYKEEIIQLTSEDEIEHNTTALSKMRLCLSKSVEPVGKFSKSNAPNRQFLEDEDAMFPEYSSEQKTLLTMIKDTTSKKSFEVSQFGSVQTKSFITIANSKKISNHDLSNSIPHSNSTYLFMPTDSLNKQSSGTKPIDSDDNSKLGSYKATFEQKTLPSGSIFSFLNENKHK